jgi:energy-coupling factor transport system permease protein
LSNLVQYHPGATFLHRLDPRVKIILLIGSTLVVFAIQDLPLAIVLLAVVGAVWWISGLPLSTWGGYLRLMLGMMAFIFAIQAFLYPGKTVLVGPLVLEGTPLVGGWGVITLEGIGFALLLSVRLLTMISLLPIVTMTTPIHRLVLGLVRLGLPYTLAYTATTTLNLIPILQEEARNVVDAQKLRALRAFERGNLLDKLGAYPPLVVPLVVGAMRRAQLMSIAMDARGFGAYPKRTYVYSIAMSREDWLALILGLGLCAISLAITVAGAMP